MIDSKMIGESEGFKLRMELEYDLFADLTDCEITDKQTQAYLDAEWCFVTAEVIASKAGVDLGSATYGALEYGYFLITDEHDNPIETKNITIHDIDNWVGSELSGEAISNAQEKLAELLKGEK
jgi:hypothetical protein